MNGLLAILFMFLTMGQPLAGEVADSMPKAPMPVSIIEVIANKDQYHGKQILIRGYFSVGFERCGLFLSAEDAFNGVTKNGLWCEFTDDLASKTDITKLNKKYLSIKGTFNAKSMGHMGGYSGTIEKIKNVYVVRPRKTR